VINYTQRVAVYMYIVRWWKCTPVWMSWHNKLSVLGK